MTTNKVRQASIKPTGSSSGSLTSRSVQPLSSQNSLLQTGSNIVVSTRWHTLTLPLTINSLQNSRFEPKYPLLGLLGQSMQGTARQGRHGIGLTGLNLSLRQGMGP